MATGTRRRACFRITGEAITAIHRGLLLDGTWGRALRDLQACVEGLSHEQATGILEGETRLAGGGRAGPRLEAEEPRARDAHRAAAHGLYGGGYRDIGSDHVLRPYAYVRDYGPGDIGGGGDGWEAPGSRARAAGRALRYADDPRRDAVHVLDLPGRGPGPMAVLFGRQDPQPPPWIGPEAGPAAAVARAEALRGPLRRRGRTAARGDAPENREATAWGRGGTLEEREARWGREECDALREREEAAAGLARIRREIAAQADAPGGGGWLELDLTRGGRADADAGADTDAGAGADAGAGNPDGGILRVPRAPFARWALGRDGAHLAPAWRGVAPAGLKMQGDDPDHSDWVLGAGLDPGDAYPRDGEAGARARAVRGATWDARHALRRELLGRGCAVLSGRGATAGEAVHPGPDEEVPAGSIAVVPHAGPEYWAAARSACALGDGAVIAETGGKLAHLALLGREAGPDGREAFRLVVVPGARRLFPAEARVRVDCASARAELANW